MEYFTRQIIVFFQWFLFLSFKRYLPAGVAKQAWKPGKVQDSRQVSIQTQIMCSTVSIAWRFNRGRYRGENPFWCKIKLKVFRTHGCTWDFCKLETREVHRDSHTGLQGSWFFLFLPQKGRPLPACFGGEFLAQFLAIYCNCFFHSVAWSTTQSCRAKAYPFSRFRLFCCLIFFLLCSCW